MSWYTSYGTWRIIVGPCIELGVLLFLWINYLFVVLTDVSLSIKLMECIYSFSWLCDYVFIVFGKNKLNWRNIFFLLSLLRTSVKHQNIYHNQRLNCDYQISTTNAKCSGMAASSNLRLMGNMWFCDILVANCVIVTCHYWKEISFSTMEACWRNNYSNFQIQDR